MLVGENNWVKIADFGMARPLDAQGQYTIKEKGVFPFKWMSVEALRDRVFSEKSDVWAFGTVRTALFE